MTWQALLTLALTTLVSAGFGSYLSGYFKKKGENLATHEDIEKVRHEVEVVTTATKEIEAKISDQVWDRQKRWEAKREALFEVTKRIANVKDALSALYAIHQTDKQLAKEGRPPRFEKRAEVYGHWNETANRFEEATLLARLSCEDDELYKVLLDFSQFTRNVARQTVGERPDAFTDSAKEFLEKLEAVHATMRKEIKK